MLRRIAFLVLGVLALGVAGMNASWVEPDAQVPHFIGGAFWAVLCFAVALWPSKAARPERDADEPGARRRKRAPRPWDR